MRLFSDFVTGKMEGGREETMPLIFKDLPHPDRRRRQSLAGGFTISSSRSDRWRSERIPHGEANALSVLSRERRLAAGNRGPWQEVSRSRISICSLSITASQQRNRRGDIRRAARSKF